MSNYDQSPECPRPTDDPVINSAISKMLDDVDRVADEPRRSLDDLIGSAISRAQSADSDLESLVAAAGAGDRSAVNRVLVIIRPLIVRYCRARIGRQERSSVFADDVAQEVCLAVLTALPGYRDQGRPFLAFVYGIAAHKVVDAHRSVRRSHFEPVEELPEELDPRDGPEQRALNGALSVQMGQLLDILPPKQREILVLRVVVGLSAEETAEAVESTPGAVRVAQHRAVSKLRSAAPEELVAEAREIISFGGSSQSLGGPSDELALRRVRGEAG